MARVTSRIEDVFAAVETLCRKASAEGRRVCVAIDGRCGCGKSTLASQLAEKFNGCVIHMDDFFLPFSMRVPERTSFPGWNVHIERFEREVVPYLKDNEEFEYGIFDCGSQEISGMKRVEGKFIIVEGSYSMRPEWRGLYGLKIFVTSDADEQRRRILARSGQTVLERFESVWIPLEEEYFKAFGVEAESDVVYRT